MEAESSTKELGSDEVTSTLPTTSDAPKCLIVGESPETLGSARQKGSDPVEVALAEALARASAAGEWAVVAQLARELEARRKAHEDPNVVPLRPPKREPG